MCCCGGIVTTQERCYTKSTVHNGLQRGWFTGLLYPSIVLFVNRFVNQRVENRSDWFTSSFHKSLNSNDLGNGVTVARLTLDQLVGVQILIPQFS